jgi:dihydroorotate dehydrogenase (NAD+) catalytic subunit
VVSAESPGLVLDRVSLRPRLQGVGASVCGPGSRATGLAEVYELRRTLPEAVIVAVGGIVSGADALDYLAAGADAVQVGSVLLADPGAAARIVSELRTELEARRLPDPAAARGLAHRDRPSEPDAATTTYQTTLPTTEEKP